MPYAEIAVEGFDLSLLVFAFVPVVDIALWQTFEKLLVPKSCFVLLHLMSQQSHEIYLPVFGCFFILTNGGSGICCKTLYKYIYFLIFVLGFDRLYTRQKRRCKHCFDILDSLPT